MDKISALPMVEQVAQVARLAARLVIESGGETYRAEDTVYHIAHHFGYEADIIAFPTGLTMTLTGGDESCSMIARVERTGTDLARMDQVNTVSRALCGCSMTLEQAYQKLEEIQHQQSISNLKSVIYAGVSAAMFAMMFGGGIFEFLGAGVCGALIQLVLCYSPDQAGMPVSSLIGGFLASILALLINAAFGPGDVSMTIVSTLMPFLPGLALTNAIRDSMRGDLLSGGARLFQALTRAVVLAGGAGAGLWLYMAFGGNVNEITTPETINYITGFLGSFGASLFFALLFHVPKRTLLTSSAIGGVTYIVYLLAYQFTGSTVGGCFIASIAIALLSEFTARHQHAPASIFTSVAVIPLVPGGGLYKTMYAIVQDNYTEAVTRGAETILIAGCIALAIALVTSFSRSTRRKKH